MQKDIRKKKGKIKLKYILIIISSFTFILFSELTFRIIERKHKDIHVQYIRKLSGFLIVIVTIFCALYVGEETRPFITTIMTCTSLLVAVAAFAAQQTLADMIAGFMLSVSRPYNINERITLINSNITGIVEGITMRHTIIRLYDNNRLLVPNSVINKEIIKNSNYIDSKIGNFLEVEISYESNLEKAISLIKIILEENNLVVDKDKINILVKDFTANGVILKTTVWTKDVDDNFKACSDIRQRILNDFNSNKITIPYPHVEIIQKQNFPIKDD